MLLEQVYLFFIYILFFELAIVTVVAIALFVALIVAIRKLDNEKKHLCLRCILIFKIIIERYATSKVVSHLSIIRILKIYGKVK